MEINSSNDPLVPELLDLAHGLFEPETLEPDSILLDELDSRRPCKVRYFALVDQGMHGFCRAAWLSEGILIVHLGVYPVFQGSGVGTRLLSHIQGLAELSETNGALIAFTVLPVFAEVEQGNPSDWWLSKGAKPIWRDYIQPPLRSDTGPVPLTLVAIGNVSEPKNAIRAIYQEFYARPTDDSLLMRVLGEEER
ncbi:MAG: N-acetyltransferase [Verrucomicrobiaceae bacterium]|nr:MAG: N-acetyltransferase [Verrucomicrobiaceae bacterium]